MKSLLKSFLYAFFLKKHRHWVSHPEDTQKKVSQQLIEHGRHTLFGRQNHFHSITNYTSFKEHVPLCSYETLLPYIERISKGEKDVLWPGRPSYFTETSGTTAYKKYIPLTTASLHYQTLCARLALMEYIHRTGRIDCLKGRLLFLSGSAMTHTYGVIPAGRLSGIMNRHVPLYLRVKCTPCAATNKIQDFKRKIASIVRETSTKNVTLLAGIPPWVQHYLDELLVFTQKQSIHEIFPQLALYMHGGVNYAPYHKKFMQTIGRPLPTLETYPSSEGFIAYQNTEHVTDGLLLMTNHGIFYEFIPLKEAEKANPPRYALWEIQTDTPYVLVINSVAGLWGYVLGDVVSFTSLAPPRLRVVGRSKHYISAFGEHVISEEIDAAMQSALDTAPEAVLTEFTVAPHINPKEGLSHHQWLVEFSTPPVHLDKFADTLDQSLQKRNPYYADLRKGSILGPAKLSLLQKGAFRKYMQTIHTLDPQNKVPRLSNDDVLAKGLAPYLLPSTYVD